jgi:hypothetical protein
MPERGWSLIVGSVRRADEWLRYSGLDTGGVRADTGAAELSLRAAIYKLTSRGATHICTATRFDIHL